MNQNNNNMDKLSVRLDFHSMLKINELSDKLNCSKSLLIRTIIQNFINSKESSINNILDN